MSLRPVNLELSDVVLDGDLSVPDGATGLVVFAHGSGSSRVSPRNRAVAERLRAGGLATLLFDLLTEDEASDRTLVFDIGLLGRRLAAVVDLTADDDAVATLPVGLFGASTGAAAALAAAAAPAGRIGTVVSRGGRPDLAPRLSDVHVPVLLIVGSADADVLDLNRSAAGQLGGDHELAVVAGAGHLFDGPGQLEEVAELAVSWFRRHLSHGGDATSAGAR